MMNLRHAERRRRGSIHVQTKGCICSNSSSRMLRSGWLQYQPRPSYGRTLKPDWPGTAEFAICLTHDVDRVRKTKFHSLYYFFKQRRWHHISTLLDREGSYWDFERIMQMESKYEVRSTFFFLNERDLFRDRPLASLMMPKEWLLYYSNYRTDDPAIRDTIRRLDRDGWEIGLHGSYESYASRDMLNEEKRMLETTLGTKIIGTRQHYLRLIAPLTWEIQRAVGFRYDSSLGSALVLPCLICG